jgi:hypothetical protein
MELGGAFCCLGSFFFFSFLRKRKKEGELQQEE